MKVRIIPSLIDGTINAPSSKSVAQRAIASALLAQGNSLIKNITWSNDVLAAISVAENLGAIPTIIDNNLNIKGGRIMLSPVVNCGESALCMRMFAPIAALYENEITLNASGSLLKRPIGMIENSLRQMGAVVNTQNGFPPITIKGPIKGGVVKVDGSVSSQVLSGLLLALAVLREDSIIETESLVSRHYVDITLSVMNSFGVTAENQNYQRFVIKGNQNYKPTEFYVEGDWSSCSFLLVAAAIAGKIKIKNLSDKSIQPDKKILEVLESVGASIKIKEDSIVCKHKSLNAFSFDATDCPDLFPPLVALASKCKGISKIHGTNRLQYKESNRLEVILREFSKMGIQIKNEENTLFIESGALKSCEIFPENDHRIAMAAAITYLGSNQTPIIYQAECVNKSFPGFWDEIKCLGVQSEIIHE